MDDNFFKINKKIGIISNDAGASNLILGWVINNPSYNFLYYLKGPGKKIFFKKLPNLLLTDKEKILSECDTLITGTSFPSNLEYNFRKEAKKRKIQCIAVLDHWVNYKKRFIRKGKIILPDIIWVFDEFAEKKALRLFKNVKVERKENNYLGICVSLIKELEKKIIRNDINILYVLEPINRKSSYDCTPYEFKVLDYFINNLKKLKLGQDLKIRLRPHPREPKNKYESWLKCNKNYNIALSTNNTLEEDIAWSEIVVGYDTYALVVASASSKNCYSSKPPKDGNCNSRVKDLKYLRDIK